VIARFKDLVLGMEVGNKCAENPEVINVRFIKFVNIKGWGYKKVNRSQYENQNIPEGSGKGNIRKSKCDEDEKKRIEDEVDFEDNAGMMYSVESIEQSGAIMTCKMDVDKKKIDK
ncbi:26282_t:CDS:2, partial [Gigaspora margarita]